MNSLCCLYPVSTFTLYTVYCIQYSSITWLIHSYGVMKGCVHILKKNVGSLHKQL